VLDGGYLASRLLKYWSLTFDRVTDSLIFNTDCVSNGLGRNWFPITSYRWKWFACCAHQRLLFQHIHKFLLCKDVRPSKRSLFHCPPPACHSCLPISSAVCGANLIFTNSSLVFETFQIRRTSGSGYINTLKELPGFKEEPVVIWLIQIVFVDHGLYISKYGYLIFLRIVMMNLHNRHDAQQGFLQFIIPDQQWSTSLVSHRSSQDSLLPRHHRYIYLRIDRGANLQDSPTTKVEIISNRLLKLVASALIII
jgi:hypothetical protein